MQNIIRAGEVSKKVDHLGRDGGASELAIAFGAVDSGF